MAAAASSSASTSKSESIDISEAVNHLIQGKRHMLVLDFPSAVSSLQSATETFAEKYGEMANECGEPYFLYGRALLELARMETGVLGNALDGVPEDDEDSESSNSNKEQVENPDDLSDDDDDDEEKDEEEKDENDEEEEEDDEKEVTIEKSPESKKEEEEENNENDEKEEDISNLQLAWEVIELAKIIFERQSENKDMKLKTAHAYLKLGEIAIESGNYGAADEDLTKCLKIRQDELEPDDRLIAETHFQLGITYSFNSEFDKGRSSYEEALKVIKYRILNLENKLVDPKEKDKVDDIETEIKDLKELIPEINSKIEDTEDMKRNEAKAREEALKEAFAQQKVMAGTEQASPVKDPFGDPGFTSSSTNGAFSTASPTKPVSNIGHLVRKKRKPDADSSEVGSPLKKVCTSTENIIPTDSNINGTSTSSSGDKS